MVDKNILLTNLDNVTLNAGTAHILRHTSAAMEFFGNRKRTRFTHYGDRVSIKYNEWQDKLAKYKVPSGSDMMTHADLGKGQTYEQFIPRIEHGCASEFISEPIMKTAMGSQESLAEFLADKIELASSRGAWEIDELFLDHICDDRNYKGGDDPVNSTAIFAGYDDEFAPGKDDNGLENFRKLNNSVIATASDMIQPSRNFNKMGIMSKCSSFKGIGAIISSVIFGQSQDYYGNMMHPLYVDLANNFAWVKVLPIHDPKFNANAANANRPKRDKHIILMHVDGYILDIDKDSPTGFDETRKTFLESWYYKWIFGYQAIGEGYNMVCWKTLGKRPETQTEE